MWVSKYLVYINYLLYKLFFYDFNVFCSLYTTYYLLKIYYYKITMTIIRGLCPNDINIIKEISILPDSIINHIIDFCPNKKKKKYIVPKLAISASFSFLCFYAVGLMITASLSPILLNILIGYFCFIVILVLLFIILQEFCIIRYSRI